MNELKTPVSLLLKGTAQTVQNGHFSSSLSLAIFFLSSTALSICGPVAWIVAFFLVSYIYITEFKAGNIRIIQSIWRKQITTTTTKTSKR